MNQVWIAPQSKVMPGGHDDLIMVPTFAGSALAARHLTFFAQVLLRSPAGEQIGQFTVARTRFRGD